MARPNSSRRGARALVRKCRVVTVNAPAVLAERVQIRSDPHQSHLWIKAMRDIQAYDAALADTDEAVPREIMRRLVAGESPIRVWRTYRGLTQVDLAREAGIDKTYLSQLESGRKVGSVAVLKRLADILSTEVDSLISESSAG